MSEIIPMTEIERLVAVETKLTSVEKTVNKIDQKLDILIPTFATTQQLGEAKAEVNVKITALANDLAKSKTRSNFQTWITGILAMGFGVIMTILIQSYLAGGRQ